MNTKVYQQDEHFVIAVSGDINTYNIHDLRELFGSLDTKGLSSIIMDMKELTYVDTSAIGALLAIQRSLTEQQITFGLVHVPCNFSDILQLASLTSFFTIYTDFDDLALC